MTKKVEIPKKEKDIVTFTTSLGKTVIIRKIPQLLLDKIQASIDRPEPPKYKIITASGEEVWESHTENTLETDDDKLLYKKYKEAMTEADNKLNENMFKVIIMRGIDIPLPEDTSWIDMQRFLGVKIPDDPLELKYLYIQTEIIGTAEDIVALTSMVMEMTGVPEDALAEARKSFQGIVQRTATPENGEPGEQQVES